MTRVKSGVVTHARHRKVVKAAKGYYGARSRNFRTAKQAVDRAMQYATRDRKVRKRVFRALPECTDALPIPSASALPSSNLPCQQEARGSFL